MSIQELKNPLTNEYKILKNIILSQDIDWRFAESCVPNSGFEIPFLTHPVVERSDYLNGNLYPKVCSTLIDICEQVLKQFFQHNDISVNYILRISFNLTFPIVGAKRTGAHVDHEYPHKNLIVYLNESDGDTVTCTDEDEVVKDFSKPEEDKIIIFSGKHYHKLPTKNKRVVMVCTFV